MSFINTKNSNILLNSFVRLLNFLWTVTYKVILHTSDKKMQEKFCNLGVICKQSISKQIRPTIIYDLGP